MNSISRKIDRIFTKFETDWRYIIFLFVLYFIYAQFYLVAEYIVISPIMPAEQKEFLKLKKPKINRVELLPGVDLKSEEYKMWCDKQTKYYNWVFYELSAKDEIKIVNYIAFLWAVFLFWGGYLISLYVIKNWYLSKRKFFFCISACVFWYLIVYSGVFNFVLFHLW